MTPFQGKLRLRHLDTVLAVSDCGSLSRAALQLNMTQSGLSRAIAEIEEIVGGRLFDRTGKGMVCTLLGETLCRHAGILIGDLAKAETDLSAVSAGGLGSLTVGCFSMFSTWPLAEAVGRFRAAHPRMMLNIQVGTHERLIEDLDSAKLDVLISRRHPTLNPAVYRTTTLLEDVVVIACGPRHPLARQAAVTLEACLRFPWIGGPPKNRVRDELERRLRERGCAPPPMVGALSLDLSLEMLAGGECIAMLPGSVAHVLQRRGALRVLPVTLDLQPSPLAAIWRRERSSTRQVRAFTAALAKVIRAESALGD